MLPAASWRGTLTHWKYSGEQEHPCVHTHVPRALLLGLWGAHAAARPPPHTITAWQLFPWSEIEPASRGCRYLISWICHLQCLLLPLAPGSSCQALRSPRKQAEQAARSLPALSVHLWDVCPALTQPAFKGLIQLCFFPLPLFSPSWATLSSLAAS